MPKKILIDANELLELYEAPDDMPEWDAFVVPIPVVRQNILDMPIVDAVEVTRCKNCRNYESIGEDYGNCRELNHCVAKWITAVSQNRRTKVSIIFGLCISAVLLCLTFWACSALVGYALNFLVAAKDAIEELRERY